MTPQVLRLGTATYDPGDMSLRRADGTAIDLSNKARDALACLADAAGDVVARETLVNTVWPNVPVEETTITRVMAEIREAIGDGDKEMLRPVPRVGFQLIGAWVGDEEEDAPTSRGRWRWLALVIIALLILLRFVERI